MHSKIIEIGTVKKNREDYISEDSVIYEEFNQFADYIQDVSTECKETIIEWFDDLDFFDRNGRELTLKPMNKFIDDWKKKIVETANNLDLSDWMSYYGIKDVIKKTHKKWAVMICMNGEEFWDFGFFIQHLCENHKPGDKFYIGGILDYHY